MSAVFKINYVIFTGIISVLFILSGENLSRSKYKYVGVNTCIGACHKSEEQGNQFSIWQNSAHSKAFLTLQTERADSIAKAKGYETRAAETPQCVKCHVLGKDIDESELKGSFDKAQGVQCESCHGPGSEYRKLSVMKDKGRAVEKGLIIHTEKEKFCIHCHNEESPTYFEFNYEPMWEIIAHYKPKEK
ncbi:MAG: hypothetical protein HGGPFJEG_01604 [Ignavibacteria bacterium]|nr:hypothetical protein [Ignavibacteria bacterium]